MFTVLIGKNIKKLREEFKLSQKELSEKLHIARPVISNWENGKSEPSSSQLQKLSRIFSTSTDSIVGNTREKLKVVIVDTSALIKRPSIVDELENFFNEVVIPQVVISELNNLKDRGNPSIKQKAWLVMKSIAEKSNIFIIEQNINNDGNNDEKIANVAIRKATLNPYNEIYLLSDDIYFQFLTKSIQNISVITPLEYFKKFHATNDDYDFLRSIEFVSLVKNKKHAEIEQFDIKNVNVNFHDPDTGLTSLMYAIRNRDIYLIEYLLRLKKIDLNIRDKHKYNFSAIHHATQIKSIEIINILVKYGVDIDIGSTGKNAGNTALMIASWSGFSCGVDFFLSHDLSVNQQDNNGYTALMKACIKNDKSIVKKLIIRSDITIKSRDNKRAIDYLDVNNPKSSEIFELFKG